MQRLFRVESLQQFIVVGMDSGNNNDTGMENVRMCKFANVRMS